MYRLFLLPPLFLLFALNACTPPPGPEAFYNRGKGSYLQGNFQKALPDLRRIAEQGHARGQYLLAQMYANGEGVTQDLYQARVWYQKAAGRGLPEAQNTLGVMLEFGSIGNVDLTGAIQWYKKAADHGYAPAQLNLANMLSQTDSPHYDPVNAYKWYSLVLRFDLGNSRKKALLERRKLDKILTKNEIETAERLAREWNFPLR